MPHSPRTHTPYISTNQVGLEPGRRFSHRPQLHAIMCASQMCPAGSARPIQYTCRWVRHTAHHILSHETLAAAALARAPYYNNKTRVASCALTELKTGSHVLNLRACARRRGQKAAALACTLITTDTHTQCTRCAAIISISRDIWSHSDAAVARGSRTTHPPPITRMPAAACDTFLSAVIFNFTLAADLCHQKELCLTRHLYSRYRKKIEYKQLKICHDYFAFFTHQALELNQYQQ
jgi:hypothetical protein